MNVPSPLPSCHRCHRFAPWAIGLVLAAGLVGLARAHGDEPHGDAPHAPVAAPALPRFETATESFELVGRLEAGVLQLDLQRFDTSEPVAAARIDLELGTRQASARYEAETGRYRIDDPALLQALAAPGTHAMVLTVTAGETADLMDATLEMAAPAGPPAAAGLADHLTGIANSPLAAGAVAVLLAALAFLAGRRSARRSDIGGAA